MTNAEFMNFMQNLTEYLESEKAFIKNPARLKDIQRASEIANELFADSTVAIVDDKLQLGSLVIRIDGYDITIRGTGEIELFRELIAKADNFEIYPMGDEKLRFAIMFNGALIKLPQGK